MHGWRIFIASSSKGYRYAQAAKAVIDDAFKANVCYLWNQGSFETGKSFLDSLEMLPTKYNCGLAVFTADDVVGKLVAPRDNVVLEFGLFLGAFGRQRSFLLVEDFKELKIPTDYQGIQQGTFYSCQEKASIEDLRNTVATACNDVVEHMRRLAPPGARPDSLSRIERNWQKRPLGEQFKLFSFLGLTDSTEETSTGAYYECIHYLWADAGAGSSIRTRVVEQGADGETFYEVQFDNQPDGFPGNVCFRLRKRQIVHALPERKRYQRLRFWARLPEEASVTARVNLSVRLVDNLLTQWEYCRVAHEYCLKQIERGKGWQAVEVDLDNRAHWCVFPADGNSLYHDDAPDFSLVLGVIVEFGVGGAGRPGPGAGVVQLKGFRLE